MFVTAPGRTTMRRILRAASVVALTLTAGGCTDPVGSGLIQGAELWAAQGITSYVYQIRRNCFCGGPFEVRVTVEDGVKVSTVDVETDTELEPNIAQWYPTVDGLFEILRDAVEREAHSIRVEYHPEMGYPTSFFIDYEEFTADEELGFDVTGEVMPTN